MLFTPQSGLAKAVVLFAMLFILEAAPTRVFGCPILVGGRHGGRAAPSCQPYTFVIPVPAEPQKSLSLPPHEQPDDILLDEEDPITPAAFEPEQHGNVESTALLGVIGGIRPTGFLPSFLAPTGGGAFSGGLGGASLGFPGGGGGSGGGSGGGFAGMLLSTTGGGASLLPIEIPGSSGSGGGGTGGGGTDPPVLPTPEPSTLILASIGVAGLLGMAFRRRILSV